MKTVITVTILCGFINCTYAQNTTSTDFLVDFLRMNKKSDSLYFWDHIDKQLLNRAIDLQKSNDSVYYNADGKKVIFSFLPEERDFIIKELSKQTKLIWDDNLFKSTIAARKYQPLDTNATKEEKIRFDEYFFYKQIVLFSKPVFVRNNSLCFLIYGDKSGVSILIFKKEKDEWRKAMLKTILFS
jgi:hypothetical protein